jgi:hypothetical protein
VSELREKAELDTARRADRMTQTKRGLGVRERNYIHAACASRCGAAAAYADVCCRILCLHTFRLGEWGALTRGQPTTDRDCRKTYTNCSLSDPPPFPYLWLSAA